MRVYGDASVPTLVYLPGLHGDWTLISSFRAAIAGRARFVEFTYPRTTTWSLDHYARAIEETLLANGIERGWVLGESFGSLPAWQLVKHFLHKPGAAKELRPAPSAASAGSQHSGALPSFPSREGPGVDDPDDNTPGFRAQGLILSGGFVRHPVIWAVRLAGRVSSAVPLGFVKSFCTVYARYAKFRHKHAPETLASVAEFVANRTLEADRKAIVHRYHLIADNDLRPVARQTRFPVYYLAGLVDPLVPWCYVRAWLRKNCPGYRGGRTMWRADHNVLGTAPQKSAEQILEWISNARLLRREVGLPDNPSRRVIHHRS